MSSEREDHVAQPRTRATARAAQRVTAPDAKISGATNPIRCKDCNHGFATISIDGRCVPLPHQEPVCTSCEPFRGLYETLESRASEYTALLDRGPKHHGRALAHDKYRNARVKLENFVIATEASKETSSEVAQADLANRGGPAQIQCTDDAGVAHEHGDRHHAFNGDPAPTGHDSPTEVSPTTKRKVTRNPITSNLERKRIKFTESAEERSQYRCTLEFYRGAKEYRPGRYGATEGSEFLDTSGSTVSFTKFTGQKKMGSIFVDVEPRSSVERDRSESLVAPKKEEREGKEILCGPEEPQHEPEHGGNQTISRELRALQRSWPSTPSEITRLRRNIKRHDGDHRNFSKHSLSKPSLVVFLKIPSLIRSGASTNEEGSIRTSNPMNDHCWSPFSKDSSEVANEATNEAGNEAGNEAAEATNIKEVLINIQREPDDLQKVASSPRHRDSVTAAVRGFTDISTPLIALNDTRTDCAKDAEGTQEEETLESKALDAIDHSISPNLPQMAETAQRGNIVIEQAQATIGRGGMYKADIGPTLDVNIFKGVLSRDNIDVYRRSSDRPRVSEVAFESKGCPERTSSTTTPIVDRALLSPIATLPPVSTFGQTEGKHIHLQDNTGRTFKDVWESGHNNFNSTQDLLAKTATTLPTSWQVDHVKVRPPASPIQVPSIASWCQKVAEFFNGRDEQQASHVQRTNDSSFNDPQNGSTN
ncbi:hypothetical protein C7974DRAFT_399418 [Boeremia exigua]|uniref:uncharacterized protein n=1 Tax=Boeremia exigua TaxID=749465 RepID=UPI001E8DAFE4|nr:uncharacterized protein C7974DRAFT_399418 [Boeremia exigua]KAH6620301.1 hypothetical protein C7974DRAFT_399418 [Boeremia exigua]